MSELKPAEEKGDRDGSAEAHRGPAQGPSRRKPARTPTRAEPAVGCERGAGARGLARAAAQRRPAAVRGPPRSAAHPRGAAVRRLRAAGRAVPAHALGLGGRRRRAARGAEGLLRQPRHQPGQGRGQVGLPHRRGPLLPAGAQRHRAAAPVEGGHGDAGHHRLPPARDARRDRGDPRRRRPPPARSTC